jgi:transcriptional regulator with GAF, ATPase, and Fis domain
MPGHPEASVTLLVRDKPSTVASTDQLASDLDETQYGHDYGPCLHAARTGMLTGIVDPRTDSRWPDYMPWAAQHGNLSSLSVPLAIDQDARVSGALNIYAREAYAFDEDSRSAATSFAPYAAVAAGNLHAYRSAVDRAANLQVALETRGVIDQAKGILMDRHKLSADQAFQVLAQMSMKTNRKVDAVAYDLVHTRELPHEIMRPVTRRG